MQHSDASTNVTSATGPDLRRQLLPVRLALIGYLALGVLLLIMDLLHVVGGHGADVSSFMWGRSAGVVGSGAAFLWFAAAAARGQRWALRRLRIVSIAVPVIIVAMMIIPGVAPLWFKIIQLCCAACIAVVAVVIIGSRRRFRA